VKVKDLPREEYLLPGHAACAGCGPSIALRHTLKALGRRTILVIPACCTSIIQGPFPVSAVKVPIFNMVFAAAASTASGIAAGLKAQGIEDVTVVAWAGDGGTADIGIQALSGAAERGDNILYICYDNEAYMNTGIQRSGATPYGAWTTTTPTGKLEHKKNLPMIMAAHGIPYVATASPAYPLDLYAKVKKAMKIKGTRYIHIHAPCPTGWRYPSSKTVEVGRRAVQTGMWVLFEIENGKFKLSRPSAPLVEKSRRRPVEEYVRMQGRFRDLTDEDIAVLQAWVDEVWENYKKLYST